MKFVEILRKSQLEDGRRSCIKWGKEVKSHACKFHLMFIIIIIGLLHIQIICHCFAL